MLWRLALFCALLCGAVSCGDDGGKDLCDFDIQIDLSVQPTYNFTGGPAMRLNVVRSEDPLTIVWGVATPGADDLASPVVHGTVPDGAIETAGQEPTLSGGIDYTVIVTRSDGSECEADFIP